MSVWRFVALPVEERAWHLDDSVLGLWAVGPVVIATTRSEVVVSVDEGESWRRLEAPAVGAGAAAVGWHGRWLYVASAGAGVVRRGEGGWEQAGPDLAGPHALQAFGIGPDGGLWLTARTQAWTMDDPVDVRSWRSTDGGSTWESIATAHADAFAFTPDGVAWIASDGDVQRFDGGAWVAVPFPDYAHRLFGHPDGRLIAASLDATRVVGAKKPLRGKYVARVGDTVYDGTACNLRAFVAWGPHLLAVAGEEPCDGVFCLDGDRWLPMLEGMDSDAVPRALAVSGKWLIAGGRRGVWRRRLDTLPRAQKVPEPEPEPEADDEDDDTVMLTVSIEDPREEGAPAAVERIEQAIEALGGEVVGRMTALAETALFLEFPPGRPTDAWCEAAQAAIGGLGVVRVPEEAEDDDDEGWVDLVSPEAQAVLGGGRTDHREARVPHVPDLPHPDGRALLEPSPFVATGVPVPPIRSERTGGSYLPQPPPSVPSVPSPLPPAPPPSPPEPRSWLESLAGLLGIGRRQP